MTPTHRTDGQRIAGMKLLLALALRALTRGHVGQAIGHLKQALQQ